MKAEEVLNYEELFNRIYDFPSIEDAVKLYTDEVGARQAWRIVSLLREYKGFDEGFWMDIPEECRCAIFNDIANLFRDSPLRKDADDYIDELGKDEG